MKIEKNIPAPEGQSQGRPRLYRFDEMEVGDCATIDASYNTIYTCLHRWKDKQPNGSSMEFRIRRYGKKMRVWRLK